MTIKFLAFLLSIAIFTTHCSGTKHMSNHPCEQEGTVIDLSGLDGCQLLIKLPSGEKLLPLSLPENAAPLVAGQEIAFDYEIVPDVMSICMAESEAVNITCLKQKGSVSNSTECTDTESPMKIRWMKQAINHHQAVQIVRYQYQQNTMAYLFVGKEKYLYDCYGKLICSSNSPNNKDCLLLVSNPKKGLIIWVKEYRGD